LIVKKLISRVFPGVSEIFAKPFLPVSMLIREDLPTLDRPMKANSGRADGGHDFRSGALMAKVADLIFMVR
jgi:hypothetical protein